MKLKKWCKYFIALIIIIILVVIGYFCFFYHKETKDKTTFVEKEKVNKTIEVLKADNLYDSKYSHDYKQIEYVENENFSKYVNDFLKKGYAATTVNQIFKNLSAEELDYVFKNEKMNLEDYLEYRNFDVDKYSRYEKYAKDNKDLKLQDVITRVNLKLDYNYYENATEISNPSDINVLVNKYNYLPSNYVPANLTKIKSSNTNATMIKEAADAFEKLVAEAKKAGFTLLATTAYRGYNFQKILYDKYVKEDGIAKADTYSARPGFSEHQTGLTVDVRNPAIKDARLSDENYAWIKEHCSEFGFIIRYPHNTTDVTGYIEESWHLRYLGIETAKKVMDSNLTYDEYYDLYIAH